VPHGVDRLLAAAEPALPADTPAAGRPLLKS
jgi:hypothetical protein